ncbi:MAG: hypothetical protein L0H10_07485 [Comamonas sp.]|uniref:hypothetical protein n=1 Tax=Comamonas sp. TaxID=34028 RepID=UPI002648708E|nr:hypothetical protein [Comamonas sp.]MDN5503650.1 hypothetical protein [Comamonas sp.]MDN5538513.1 hypothetical protein [Comamonas sp.]
MFFLPRIPAPVSLTAMAVALLLAGPATLQAAEPARQADSPAEQDSPFFRQRRAVVEAAQARRWDDAVAQARKLQDMTLPHGNPYEQLDASGLLYTLLYQQGQYAQAVLQTDHMMTLAAADGYDPVSGQMQALIQRGLTAAMMAGDQGGLARYLQALKQESKAFAPLWQWDAKHKQLHYQAAQLSVPLVQGRWVLVQLEPARDRSDAANLEYVYLKPDGRRLRVRMRLRYDDGLKDMDAAARQKLLQQEHGIFAREQTPEPALTLPALPFADAVQSQQASREKREEEKADILHLDWGLVRGNWNLSLHAEQMDSERDSALQQLPQLWQAMQWPKAPELPPELPRQEREVASAWRVDDDWPRAGQLARAALADAQFPAELARLNTVAGISAFKAGQKAEASRYLDQALQAWPYVSLFRLESELVDQAQQYGAELAAQQGRDADAGRLMRQYLRNAGGLQNIWVQAQDPQVADLENRRTGMVLPMRAAGFHLQEPKDSQRMMYRDLMTGQQLGLTTGLKIPESDEAQEKLLRTALEKQFRLKAGSLRKRSFTAQTRSGDRRPEGREWTFEVSPQESRPGAAPAKRVVFWIVDQGASRAILRASVSSLREQTRAEQLAQALSW